MPRALEKPTDLPAAGREIVSTRIFAAPREEVFAAFADPRRLAQWWGPLGFTNTIHQFDLRPGGVWHFTMHGPNGADYPNQSEFNEVVRPERIVFQHLGPIHPFQMTMTFAKQGRKTVLTWRMLHETAAEIAQLGELLAGATEQNFDRLAAHLASHLIP